MMIKKIVSIFLIFLISLSIVFSNLDLVSAAKPYCGDGNCNGGETYLTCSQDCSAPPTPQCSDSLDNDNDGLVDLNDPGCADGNDVSEKGSLVCDNGLDDDSDGYVDLSDAGCSDIYDSSEKGITQCDNSLDDDSDTFIDMNDAGCANPSDNSEKGTMQCDNNLDDDSDGKIDYPNDPDCTSPSDNSEIGTPQCSDLIDNDGDGKIDYNRRAGKGDADCVSATDNTEAKQACADGLDNDSDGLVDLNDPGCSNTEDSSEKGTIVCDNNIDDDGDGLIDYPDDPGCSSASDIKETSSIQCDNGLDDDSNGLIDYPDDHGCTSPLDNEELTLDCSDGVDNDGDTFIDYPNDTGCSSISDSTELGYTQCDNGLDDDGDGYIDYPDDPGCNQPSDASERTLYKCDNGLDDDGDGFIDYPSDPNCDGIFDNTEEGPPQCSDSLDNDNDGFVDYPNDPGCFSTIDVSERGNFICDNGIDEDGDSYADYPDDPGCINIYDVNELGVVYCDDGIDNDGDSFIDYPDDVGCSGPYDNFEISVQCSDGIDNDGDTFIDYPNDTGCSDSEDDSEIDVMLSVQTLKDKYLVGAKVDLTDPPVKIERKSNLIENIKNEILTTIEELKIDESNKELEFSENGYIIKLKGKPLAVYKKQLEENNENDIQKRLNEHKQEIDIEHKQIKEHVNEKYSDRKVLGEYDDVFNGLALDILREEALELLELDYIEEIYPNKEYKIVLMDSVPQINADDAWSLGYTGSGVKVSVLDTGIDYTHSDLGGCFGSGCKVIDGYDFVNNDADPMDDNGHGTHVAGIIAANGVVTGVAPGAYLGSYKVCNSGGSCLGSWIMSALERSLDPNQDLDYSDKFNVVSMSLGGPGDPDDALSQSVDNSVNSGIAVVISAGNSGPSYGTVGSPGTARKAITVGAIDKTNVIASFSSRGATSIGTIKPDVVAPGVSICSSQWSNAWQSSQCIDTEHTAISGTSMAAPHVSGVAALLLQKNPTWSPDQIKYSLRGTAADLDYDLLTQGYGKVDALAAIQLTESLPVETLTTSGKVNGIINVLGDISPNNFQNYKLEYGQGIDPVTWDLLTDTATYPVGNILYSNWDTSLLNDGEHILKLTVRDTNLQTSEDNTLITIDNVYISSPVYSDWIKVDNIVEISGTVVGTNFDYYSVEWGSGENPLTWSSSGINLANNGNLEVSNGLLASWNTNGISSTGSYTIRLKVYYTDATTNEDSTVIYIETESQAGWPVNAGRDIRSSPVVADLNNDGENEIIVGSSDYKVYMFDKNGNLVPGWPQLTNSYVYASPSIADIDKDNEMEIVIASYYPGKVYAFNYDGSSVPGFPADIGGPIESAPVIADLDNNNDMEIIVSVDNNILASEQNLYVLNHDGSVYPGWPQFTDIGIVSLAAVADLDNNGDLEFVISNMDGMIYAFNHDATIVNGWPQEGNSYNDAGLSLAIGDVDNNGDLEIVGEGLYNDPIYGEDSAITIWNHDGSILNRINRVNDGQSNYGFGAMYSSPALADVDNDGDLEIIVDSFGSKVFVFQHDGTLVNGWPQLTEGDTVLWGGTKKSSVIVADIDSDGEMEIIKASGKANINKAPKLYAWNLDGTPLPNWPKQVGLSIYTAEMIFSTPSVVDIDKDNDVEIIVGGRDGKLYTWDLSGVYDQSKLEWPMFHHNIEHTGLYKTPPDKSQILNNGAADITGYLLMKVQKYNGAEWNDVSVVVDDGTARTINADEYLALDTIWANAGSYTATETGLFRVYAAFRDGTGQPIEISPGYYLEDNYEFEVYN